MIEWQTQCVVTADLKRPRRSMRKLLCDDAEEIQSTNRAWLRYIVPCSLLRRAL